MVDLESSNPVVTVGPAPPAAWVGAFVTGSRASLDPAPEGGPEDVAWADVDAARLVVVLGRKGRPFRARERRQLTALARIVDHRWTELHTGRAPRSSERHPVNRGPVVGSGTRAGSSGQRGMLWGKRKAPSGSHVLFDLLQAGADWTP